MPTTNPIIDRSREMEEKAWWDLWNTSYRTKDNNDEVSSELFVRVSAIINELLHDSGGRLLEIACGTGTLSRMLAFSSYHGLDISPAAITVAQQKAEDSRPPQGSSVSSYEAADFHDWPIPEKPFDVVACVDAISCFRDQQFVLKKMAQCLRLEGKLVLTTINPFVYYRIKRIWENGPFSHWCTRRELHELVRSAGLEIEHSHTIMPRGKLGILRIVNARRLNEAFGPSGAAFLRQLKETVGLGQYRVVVAKKGSWS